MTPPVQEDGAEDRFVYLGSSENKTGTAHTPGPWEFGVVADERIGVYADSGYRVATVHNFNGRPENSANARLIADAPALLEALKRVLRVFPTDDEMTSAGWGPDEVNDACNTYDHARSLLSKHGA